MFSSFCFAEKGIEENNRIAFLHEYKEECKYMVISSGSIQMESERSFISKHATALSVKRGVKGGFLSALYNTDNTIGKDIPAVKQGRMSDASRIGAVSEEISDSFDNLDFKMQFSTLNYLFRLFFGSDTQDKWQNAIFASTSSGGYDTYSFCETYEESETTTFETTGTVKTADGREIEFNLSVGMSRSFYEETNAFVMKNARPMIDPLVINLEDNVDAVSDQKFYFDLDCDGNLDEISSLKAGHGFLTLDKNGDGEIGDGSELFGALSGNGFMELAQYDLDGNGWIDEADEIYDRLRVWSLDSEGNPRLFSLKESDVGAICLASAPTQFSVMDGTNTPMAMVRSSGFFLRESTGMAGSIQQIDLAAG